MTGMRAGEVARAAGVGVESLRYYERRGLMPVPERSLGGHRVYSDADVTRLRVIRAAARLGFTLAEITELLDVGVHRHGPRRPGDADLHTRIEAKLEEVRSRIEDLRVVESSLEAALTAGCRIWSSARARPAARFPFRSSRHLSDSTSCQRRWVRLEPGAGGAEHGGVRGARLVLVTAGSLGMK
jgi:DNA-binding transcriptional MerR regulator